MKKDLKGLFKVNKKSMTEVWLWLIGGMLLLFVSEYLLRGKVRYVKLLLLNKSGVFLVNYLLLLLITSPIFILKRKNTFYFLMSFIIVTISGVSKYLCLVRGVPFTFSDIYSIGEGLEIAGNYVTVPMVVGVLIFLIAVIGITIFSFKKEKNKKRINSYLNPLIILVLIIVFPLVTKDQYAKGNMGYMRWDITASYKKNGYVFSTIESALKYVRVKPKGYSKEKIEKIRAIVDEKEKEDNRVINKKKSNMIFIQLEAFMDPTLIKEAKFSEDPIPNFRKICDENKGYMANVPTTGGGTVRTEYEVMTGNNIDYLTPGEIPYNTILKGKYYNSVATTLKAEGYSAHAIHNFQGNFYTRNNAYEKLGFDDFTSIEYMNNYEKNERGWVKDTILTKYIKKALDKVVIVDDLPIYKILDNEKLDEKQINIFNINPENEVYSKIKEKGNKFNLYKINVKRGMNGISYTNIIFYDNQNKTLPVGQDISTNILIDFSNVKLELKNKNIFKITNIEDEKDDFSKVTIKTVNVFEYDVILNELNSDNEKE